MVGLLKSKYLRLFFCLLLCFCLCFSMFCVPAKAVVSEGIILSAILAALTAANITISGNNISDASFVTEFQRWISTSNINFAALSDDILTLAGANQIKIKAAAWSLIDDFIAWVRSDVIGDSGSVSLGNSILSYPSSVVVGSHSFSNVSGDDVRFLVLRSNVNTRTFVLALSASNSRSSYIHNGATTTLVGTSSGYRYDINTLINQSGFYNTPESWVGDNLSFIPSLFDSSNSISISSDGIVDWSDIVIPNEDVIMDVSGFDFDSVESYVSGVVPSILDGTFSASIGDQVLDPPSDTDKDYTGILGQIGGFLSGIQSNTAGLLSNATSFFESILEDTFGFLSELPNYLRGFAGRFVGIWHYVVSWVGSLGAWFGVLFSVWRGLPYAMVVPVYASAVVVLVIGMWKRFFG